MENTVSMTKGETISLSKKAPGLKKVFAGAGWDVKANGASMDLDLAAFLLTNGKLIGAGSFVYFNNKKSACGSVSSRGDNLTGAGEGDDEVIDVNLETVSADVNEIVFVASIYQAQQKNQSLKDLDNAHIRIVNEEDKTELANFKITDTNSDKATFVLGKLVRNGSEWDFQAVGEAQAGDLGTQASNYGLATAA